MSAVKWYVLHQPVLLSSNPIFSPSNSLIFQLKHFGAILTFYCTNENVSSASEMLCENWKINVKPINQIYFSLFPLLESGQSCQSEENNFRWAWPVGAFAKEARRKMKFSFALSWYWNWNFAGSQRMSLLRECQSNGNISIPLKTLEMK